MTDEKRMIENYEVKHAIHLSGGEVILAEDASTAEPFMVCDCSWDNPFSVDVYSNIVVSADYLEVMKEFLNRAAQRVELIEKERTLRGVSNIPLTDDDCIPGSRGWNYENRLIVIKPEKLTPAARTADHQLLLATGGNGCALEALGTAVFCTNLFTGESMRWERHHVAGIIRPDRMPEWAVEKLLVLQKEKPFPDGTFAYGGYHFTPYRRFSKEEQESSLYTLVHSYQLTSDRELGMSTYDQWKKVDYSHRAFYEAAGDKTCDIFRCVENGKLYVPCENELFIYTEPTQQKKTVEKQSLLGKLEAAKKTAAHDNQKSKEPKHRKPER